MYEQVVFSALYAIVLVSALCLLFVISEVIFIWAYNHIPWVAKRWDKFCESTPDWDE